MLSWRRLSVELVAENSYPAAPILFQSGPLEDDDDGDESYYGEDISEGGNGTNTDDQIRTIGQRI